MGDQDFRFEARAWLAENFPPALAGVNGLVFQGDARAAAENADYQVWRVRMADKGWGVPTWPRRFGGADLSEVQVKVLAEEMIAISAFNPIRSFGTMMLGPTLLEYGTEEQKEQHLHPIARHELRWCQGFSEPGAGSDLASLKSKCIDMGDHWLVNGQKIWTSGADQADWCFALVRTDTSVKQAGISFLLIDMKSEGVEPRPIVLISGSTHFCEVFFNDVKVPKANMVAGLNKGWDVAKRLLQHERSNISAVRADMTALAGIAHQYLGTDAQGRIADSDLRNRLVRNAMRQDAYTRMIHQFAEEASNGGPSNRVSVSKNLWSTIAQDRSELLIELMGYNGLGWTGQGYDVEEADAVRAFLHARAFSIYGGSHEVQANITAKR